MKLLSEKAGRTIKQLAKEFWFPLAAAIAWTVYVSMKSTQAVNLESIGTGFGAAFFFTSWMTGQIFRVRKQAGVEGSLAVVEQRIQAVTDRLEHQSEQFVSHMTGGDSFCYVQVGRQGGNHSIWMLVHSGSFPMYSVNVRVCDVDTLVSDIRNGVYGEIFQIDELAVGMARSLASTDLGSSGSRRFNIFIHARNGIIVQQLRLRRIEGHWFEANRVEVSGKVVYESIDEGFPRTIDGLVEWE